MTLLRLPLLVLLALVVVTGAAEAQLLSRLPLSLHARAGAGLPVGDFASGSPGPGAEVGGAYEVGAVLRVLPLVGLYGAYQVEHFGCRECAAFGIDGLTKSRGFEAGGEVTSPIRPRGLVPWARAGVVRHTLSFASGESSLLSEPGVGFGVGGGVAVPLGPVLLSPGVRYQRYPVEVEFSGYPSRGMDVSQLTLDVGLLLPF